MAVFWVAAPCSLYNPEDSHLRTHRRENLKSYRDKKNYGYEDSQVVPAYPSGEGRLKRR
jgi:hypothetical protein